MIFISLTLTHTQSLSLHLLLGNQFSKHNTEHGLLSGILIHIFPFDGHILHHAIFSHTHIQTQSTLIRAFAMQHRKHDMLNVENSRNCRHHILTRDTRSSTTRTHIKRTGGIGTRTTLDTIFYQH